MNQEDSKKVKVTYIKGDTPQECFTNGIAKLGGISQFVEKDDIVFLKISLNIPFGFPAISNFDLVKEVILACNKAGAKKIYIGACPTFFFSSQSIDTFMGLKSFFKNLGAEFVYLENNPTMSESINKSSNRKNFSNIKNIEIPDIIFNSDRIIILNQVNVDPLFMCNLSLVNLFSIIPQKYRELNFENENYMDIVNNDKYKSNLINNIIDVNSIIRPDLIINDFFYILEKAGPYIYKDSKLKKTNLMVMGNETYATDVATLMTLGLNIEENDLISALLEQDPYLENLNDIKQIRGNIEDINLKIEPCHSILEDIKIQNILVNSGKICSGCFLKVYHLLNFIKTLMPKDLKYLKECSLLVGANPTEPKNKKNIILFGKCAINTTQNYDFLTLTKMKGFKKKKEKQVQNKAIIKIGGCPPNLKDGLQKIYDFFGKKSLPELNLIYKLLESSDFKKKKDNDKLRGDNLSD
ncbi:MAG: DUF362 domain-containing protein [Candidatus Lokiarchaeota archaeon]|nr:DUF362 domain-containing protein [Candidatus Lokiarchaeota archaeon]